MYRACIFDLDGTLADTLESIAFFGNTALSFFRLPPIAVEKYRHLVGNGADVLMERMLSESGGNPALKISLRKEYDRLYEKEPLHKVKAYGGLPQALKLLKEKNIRLGVLSNKPDNMTRCIANTLYGNLLDFVQGQLPHIPKKPDPTALLAMAASMGADPADVLYIGDSGVDMDTGKNAGMDCCGVLWGFRSKEELVAHGASYLADTAEALLHLALS